MEKLAILTIPPHGPPPCSKMEPHKKNLMTSIKDDFEQKILGSEPIRLLTGSPNPTEQLSYISTNEMTLLMGLPKY